MNRNEPAAVRWWVGKVLWGPGGEGEREFPRRFRVEEIRIRRGVVMYMGQGVAFEERLCEPTRDLAWRRWRPPRKRGPNKRNELTDKRMPPLQGF